MTKKMLLKKTEILNIEVKENNHIFTLTKNGKSGTLWLEDGIMELSCNIKNVNSPTQLINYLK